MVEFLKTSAACKLTGKSESTIKRMVREITADPEHEDCHLIRPGNEEIEALKAAGKPYSYEISEELLLRKFPQQDTTTKRSKPTSDEGVVAILREQMQAKDKQLSALETQLDRKDKQIGDLNERQREANILFKNLQERLALDLPKKKRSLLSRWLGK